MTIFLTGGSGFIGVHLIPLLLNQGHEVFALTRKVKPNALVHPSLHWVIGSITDRALLAQTMVGKDVLLHCAAELREEDRMQEVNVLGTKHVLTLAAELNYKVVIHLSSVGVIGKQFSGDVCDVDTSFPCLPQNRYEQTKWEAEQLVNNFGKANPNRVVSIFRPTNVFGEQHPRLALLQLFRYFQSNRPFIFASPSYQNYVYVGDLCAALAKAVLAQEKGIRCYHVGKAISTLEFLGFAEQALGQTIRKMNIPGFVFKLGLACTNVLPLSIRGRWRSLGNRVRYIDEAFEREYGYPFGLALGLQKTVDWFKSQKHLN